MLEATRLTPSPKLIESPQQQSPIEEKEIPVKISPEKFQMITTFTADFKPHYNVSRCTSCRPPESNHQFNDAPFEGKTTQSMAFKAWPVSALEKPLWAIKPEYKRPPVGMLLDSTYMVNKISILNHL